MESYSNATEKKRPILIWGGALYGEIAYIVLTQVYGKDIEAVIDNKQREVPWTQIKVIRAEELEKYSGIDILVCAANSFDQIVKEAGKYKRRDIRLFDCKEILADYKAAIEKQMIRAKSAYMYGNLNLDEMILKYNFYAGEKNGYDQHIYLSYCVLCITSKCSLKCKNCAAFINRYQVPSDYSLEYVKGVFGKFLSVVDAIQELELMGGEPFLCKEFDDILEWCLVQDKIRAIKIITNGTIIPTEKTWKLLNNSKVKLVIDDYGKLSGHCQELIELSEVYHVHYEVQKLQTWYQLEPVTQKDNTDQRKKEIFQDCVFRTCIGVTNGRLYHCNVAGHMNTTGLLRDEESDFIELQKKDWDSEELKDAVRTFLALPYLQACDYCNYSSHVEVLVAEQ